MENISEDYKLTIMKELSIEEKAKAYDEAIKYGQYLINERCKEGTDGSFHRSDLQKMFPELKEESEDERIRKGLLYVIEHHPTLPTEEAEEYIAWLEKQGEHADFRNKIQIGDKVTRNQDGVLVNLSQLKRVAKPAEEQGEQKPVKKEDWCFEKGKWYVKLCHDYEGDLRHFQEGHVYQAVSETSITDGYHHVSLGSWQIPKYFRPATKEEIPQKQKPVEPQHDMLSQEKYAKAVDECVYGEQKPAAWSEEDIATISRVISIVKWAAYSDHSHPILNDKGATELVERLNSLKERAQPQPKQEWSEEDEKMQAQVINEIEAIKSNSSTVFEKNIAQDKIDWLKSLKDKYTWKPSEEQMETLKLATYCQNKQMSKVLFGLYQDLKKLKG